jgi:LacI family transcriptional regulator
MPVTMRDVARKAGVSIKTVSRVVNKQGEISAETRQRVLDAIDELGYRPSKVARALVTQRTDTLGLILSDITNPFFSELASGVLEAAQAQDYDVFLCNSGARVEAEMRALYSLADHNVDGIIIFPSWRNIERLKEFAERNRPLVVINRIVEDHPRIGRILTDHRGGARLAVEHLVGKGHSEIAMLSGFSTSPDIIQRVRGFREALEGHGLPVVDERIVTCIHPVVKHGYRATRRLLTKCPQVTAIFAYNDLLAVGAIQACERMGRHVPEDCAIVGFDDIQLASLVKPRLTTVHVDKYELGRQAVIRLIEMLNEPDTDFAPIHIDVELVVREST